MHFEQLRAYCLSLPGAEEDIKWEDHFAYTVGTKIFCITGAADDNPVSLKVSEEDFGMLTERDGIQQARYFAKRQWISVERRTALSRAEWQEYIRKSYDLVFAKLPKNVQRQIAASDAAND